MTMDLSGFDPTQHADMQTVVAIPSGNYLAAIVSSVEKTTSNGDGAYLEFRFQVLEGEYQGKPLWSRLNLKNKSAEAVQIAQRELATICRAVNVLNPKDSSELHDLPMVVVVATEKRKDTGDLTNRIKGYKPKGELKDSARKVGTPAAAGVADKAPWE